LIAYPFFPYTQFQLQVDFLEARDVWLESKHATAVSSMSHQRPSLVSVQAQEQLLDAIERHRTRVFEVATQFNAIFRAQTATAEAARLLSMWMARRVHSFLDILTTELESVQDAAAVRDALEAALFFGSSLGRLGADFTAQLQTVFEPKMLVLVRNLWKDGVTQLEETLQVCREAGMATPLASHAVGESAEAESDGSESLTGPQPPPRKLMRLPPLARLVNAVLAGLNELRRCLLPDIFPALRRSLDEQLTTVLNLLTAHERAVLVPGLKGEAMALRSTAADLKTVFVDIVDPYLRGSLEAALGNGSAAEEYHKILLENLKEPEILAEEVGSSRGRQEEKEVDDPPKDEEGQKDTQVAKGEVVETEHRQEAEDLMEEIASDTEIL
jgi:hypothetical protein